MIIFIIFLIMLFLGFIFDKTEETYQTDDILSAFGLSFKIVGTFCLIVSLLVIIGVHATASKKIAQNKIDYDGLCKRYEVIKSEYEDVSKSDVIADITAWNIEVYNTKYWSENPWTNWFNPREIADNLEYIPLE